MSKVHTDECRYPSRYSPGGFVTEAQYIVELVCEKRARSLNRDLPMLFWKLDEWRKYFVSQTRGVHKLLSKYCGKSIINCVKRNNIYTLYPAWVEKVIKKEHGEIIAKATLKKVEKDKRLPTSQPIIDVPKHRTSNMRGTSAREQLLALDIEADYGEKEKD